MVLKRKKYTYKDMVSMSFATSLFYSLIWGANAVMQALLPTFRIFVTAYFLDEAISIFNGYQSTNAIYFPIALLAGLSLYTPLMNVVMSLLNANRIIYYRKKLVPEMVSYRSSLAYKHIEDPNTWDLIHRVFPYFEDRVWRMYTQILEIAGLLITILGIAITLFTQVWWIAISMIVISIPIIFVAVRAGKESYQASRDMTEIDRKQWNLSWILIDRENIEERAVYGYSDELNKDYISKFEYARKYRLNISIKNTIKQKIGGIVTTFFAIGTVIALLPSVYEGVITIGMFIALIGAVMNLSGILSWGVNQMVFGMTESREWLKDLTEFMELEATPDATALPEIGVDFEKIEFKNVSFKYPMTKKLILDQVNFTIEKGLHYSFVGENGAGKTTITKLLTGLYTNYEGEILVDGVELREFTQGRLKGLTSVVYQDFARYFMSVGDNVAIGNMNDLENQAKIDLALEQVGLSEVVTNLRDGINTPLGKVIKDGVDLSGGQWQRLAMARNVINNAPLKILDEPTSALDPIAESTLYKSFEKITKNQTTIFISHRLGSTKLADIIYVLDEGKIKEQGTHANLMALQGIYRHMYQAQAEWYTVNNAGGGKDDEK